MEGKNNLGKGVGEEQNREDEEYFLDMKSSYDQKDFDGEIEHEDSLETETMEEKESEEDSLLDEVDEGNWWDTDEVWWRNDFDKSWSDRDPEDSPKIDSGLYWPSDSCIFEKTQEPRREILKRLPTTDLKVNQNCALRKFATQRLMGDICDVWNDDGPHGIKATPMEDDIFLWEISIEGPDDSPFEGRLIRGVIQFTAEYPYVPPTVMLTPTIFHPNVSESGDVCLSGILKHWTPCHSLVSFLTSVKYLLAEPSTLDPVNPIAAEFLDRNPIVYEEIARESALQHKPTLSKGIKTREGFGVKSSNGENPNEESWFENYLDNDFKNPHEKFWEEKANENPHEDLGISLEENTECEEKEPELKLKPKLS